MLWVWPAGQPGPVLAAGSEDQPEASQAELDKRISRLIEQLGAADFATREKAQAELERLGLAAFDALHEAQYHRDIEVAMRARYLVRSIRVDWAAEDDPAHVKRILRNYGQLSEDERAARMEKLVQLEDPRALAALCRLIRFDPSHKLAKHGALLVMNRRLPDSAAERTAQARLITSVLGLSRRSAGQWLKAYARTLVEPRAAVDQWDRLARAEQQTFNQFPDQSSREIVRDLLRWEAELLHRLGDHDRSVVAMRQSIDLLDGSRQQLLDMVDWLIVRRAWSLVEDVAKRYSTQFQTDALLAYLLAEAHRQQQRPERAEQLAKQAMAMLPDEAKAHVETASELQERGLMQWAEREFRHAIGLGPPGSLHVIYASLILAEMLHDVEQELDAAKVLQQAVDAAEKDPAALEVLQNGLGRSLGSVQSRMYYFYARHHEKLGDRQQVVEYLKKAIEADPTDADVLIAMYRLPDADAQWQRTTLQKIDAARQHFREQIAQFEQQAAQAPSPTFRDLANRMVASANNQLAWLISNTTGDYDEALRCSKRSLELRPGTAGYLDTLGRCYYAKGDLENAVKYQSRAARVEPQSQQIRRQLEFFQRELERARKKKGDASPSAAGQAATP